MTPTERAQFRALGWKIYCQQEPPVIRESDLVPVKGPTVNVVECI